MSIVWKRRPATAAARRFALAIGLALTLAVPPALTQQPPPPNRLESIGKLLEASSAARSVSDDDDPEVQRLYARARDLYRKAVDAAGRGETERRDSLLDAAARTMFEAVRLVDTPIHADKGRFDFDRRRDSIEALAEAYLRVASEKGQAQEGRALDARIRAELDAAGQLLDDGDLAGARGGLDRAYAHLRGALGEIRDGDTLVKSLVFETPEQEYLYELDRNETHRMLIGVLIDEKLEDPSIRARVAPYLDRAVETRRAADASAAKRDFETAIQELDASTREYVRALRLAGVYVPG